MDPEKSPSIERRRSSDPNPRWLRFFNHAKRARQYVDGNVQGGLLSRMAIHWGMFFFTTAFGFIVLQIIICRDQRTFLESLWDSTTEFSALGLLVLTLLPAFMLDVIRFSNRFAGPMVRLRRFLKELGENGEVPQLKFRDDDFWIEVAKEFNLCRDRMIRQQLEIDVLRAQLAEYRLNFPEAWKSDDRVVNVEA